MCLTTCTEKHIHIFLSSIQDAVYKRRNRLPLLTYYEWSVVLSTNYLITVATITIAIRFCLFCRLHSQQ